MDFLLGHAACLIIGRVFPAAAPAITSERISAEAFLGSGQGTHYSNMLAVEAYQ